MTRRTSRRALVRKQRRFTDTDRIALAHTIGAVRRGQTWYRPPAPVQLTASRLELGGQDLTPHVAPRSVTALDIQVGLYGGAKARAHAFAAQAETAADWADRELHRPRHAGNMATVRFAGKPYHWRQDYTGQLKLAAGASPW